MVKAASTKNNQKVHTHTHTHTHRQREERTQTTTIWRITNEVNNTFSYEGYNNGAMFPCSPTILPLSPPSPQPFVVVRLRPNSAATPLHLYTFSKKPWPTTEVQQQRLRYGMGHSSSNRVSILVLVRPREQCKYSEVSVKKEELS